MKIDTSSPPLATNRLKRPLKQKNIAFGKRTLNQLGREFNFSEIFEGLILQDGAKRFEMWLEKFGMK